jgi:hypothetical protein
MIAVGIWLLALYAIDAHFCGGVYFHVFEGATHQFIYGY